MSNYEKFQTTLVESTRSLTDVVELKRIDRKYEVENKPASYAKASEDSATIEHYESVPLRATLTLQTSSRIGWRRRR